MGDFPQPVGNGPHHNIAAQPWRVGPKESPLAPAALLNDEEPRNLALNVHRDEHRARLCRGLNPSGDIWRIAKDLARRLDDNRPGLKTNAHRQFRRQPNRLVNDLSGR